MGVEGKRWGKYKGRGREGGNERDREGGERRRGQYRRRNPFPAALLY